MPIKKISILCFVAFFIFVGLCLIGIQINPNFQNHKSSANTIIPLTPTTTLITKATTKPTTKPITKPTAVKTTPVKPTAKPTAKPIPPVTSLPPTVGPHLTACSNNPILQNCDGADPVADNCILDGGLPQELKPIMVSGQKVGDVELEYSKKCQSYWVQAVVYINVQSVQNIVVQTVYASGHFATALSAPAGSGTSLYVQSHMSYQFNPVKTGQAGGFVQLSNGTILPLILL